MAVEERSKAHLERELAALKAQMKASGLKVPVTVAASHKYSGEEKDFEGKVYAFKTGFTRCRVKSDNFDLSAKEKAELFDAKGYLLSKEAIKNATVMNTLIERGSGVLEEIIEEETSEPSTEEETSDDTTEE